MIGDYDTGGFKELMKGLCDPNGRDGSSPNTFHFNWTQSLDADKVAAGTVTITGGDGDPAHSSTLNSIYQHRTVEDAQVYKEADKIHETRHQETGGSY